MKPWWIVNKRRLAAGYLLLILGFGVLLILFVLHWSGLFNAWVLPLKQIALLLGLAGLGYVLISRRGKHWQKSIGRIVLISLIGLNLLSYLGAYTLTHTRSPSQFGLGLPRPENRRDPRDLGMNFTTQRLPVYPAGELETWLIPAETPAQGTIVLFPGNGGTKGGQLLASARAFHQLGYDALLIDFRGGGGSSGNTRTIGMAEATDVTTAFDYAQQVGLKPPLVLYGISMGSAAILRAMVQDKIQPEAIILEVPFTGLLDAVRQRFRVNGLPDFPLAELLVFWGSVQTGFNGFAHNPIDYARKVTCPTLVLQGQQDKWITMAEVKALVQQFRGEKQLVLFPTAGHHLLVTADRSLWTQSVDQFLKQIRERK